MRNRSTLIILIPLFLFSCMNELQKVPVDFYATELFRDVQLQPVFPDSKTFVDCVPKRPIGEILEDYHDSKDRAGFDLKAFVMENFHLPDRPVSGFETDTLATMQEHISKLWPVLTRNADTHHANSSLIPLPDNYIVPGGRFSEIYYWDSYFTMLGLQVQGKYEVIGDMVTNFAFLIDSLGFIPNGNRNYYMSRSQPPFFSLMVRLLENHDSTAAVTYLHELRREYEFWMDGATRLKNPGDAIEHVVMMPDGSIMNRYFDNRPEPRPEAYKEDVHLAEQSGRDPIDVYTDIRSAAESGWDFSTRWFEDGKTFATIQTTNIIPVDLNALLYHLEMMIARAFNGKGMREEALEYSRRADARRKAILTWCWDDASGYFLDYDFVKGKKSPIKSLAGIYPLFFSIASPEMAGRAADVIENEFLKPGGVVTTLTDSDQQWDAPNGWAPLQWMTYKGLMNYGRQPLAEEIRKRWIRQNERVYQATGKMMEKYNVLDTTMVAGGGEYPNQDGFGWTNGVALALINESQKIVKP
ncbi:MAG TPA: alpha,alpha-trehalase TreF [Ohtaekwangia sp.]|nr:alpha,alpha-trehalase TreF [Ohtaekwangia sp.]